MDLPVACALDCPWIQVQFKLSFLTNFKFEVAILKKSNKIYLLEAVNADTNVLILLENLKSINFASPSIPDRFNRDEVLAALKVFSFLFISHTTSNESWLKLFYF